LCLVLHLASPPDAAGEQPSSPAEVYRTRCSRCHGGDGRSDTPLGRVLKVAPLADDARLARMSPGQIADAVRASQKHRDVAVLTDEELEAAARFVRILAEGR
jgi:mono/diheme cytochrome c family protein